MKVHQTIGADNFFEKSAVWGNKLFQQSMFRNISDACVGVVHSFISMASSLLKFQCCEHDFHESCLSTLTENNYIIIKLKQNKFINVKIIWILP